MRGAHWTDIPADVLAVLRRGAVLPAHPLALDEKRQLDRASQRALSRYYIDAGAGGLAVGVHATQFQIRDVGLYRPVLELAAETAGSLDEAAAGDDRRRDRQDGAGRRGGAHRRVRSATTPCCWASAPCAGASEDELIEHCAAVAREMPTDRLLPADGGRRHSAVARLLDALCRPRQRHRHQGRALQPLQDAGRGLRRGRRPAPRSASRSTPATTITSSPTSSRRSPSATAAGRRRCASRAACSATGACG